MSAASGEAAGNIRSGICKERPRITNGGRHGVDGLLIELSSLDFRVDVSFRLGEGESIGVPPSDRDRVLAGDLGGVAFRSTRTRFSCVRSMALLADFCADMSMCYEVDLIVINLCVMLPGWERNEES